MQATRTSGLDTCRLGAGGQPGPRARGSRRGSAQVPHTRRTPLASATTPTPRCAGFSRHASDRPTRPRPRRQPHVCLPAGRQGRKRPGQRFYNARRGRRPRSCRCWAIRATGAIHPSEHPGQHPPGSDPGAGPATDPPRAYAPAPWRPCGPTRCSQGKHGGRLTPARPLPTPWPASRPRRPSRSCP
jgi:hypothetical protein